MPLRCWIRLHAAFTFVSPICELVPASFTDVSTAPATVTLSNTVWNFGDGTPIENHPAGSTFTHLFPAPGTYTVTMYNVSAYGCNSTVTSQPVTLTLIISLH
ncbi:MAG: PKD domain-containing protein [Chitinophagaceae bacterium]|nr:PKD domain-containing protein [Chitinophagaceae bacterium]